MISIAILLLCDSNDRNLLSFPTRRSSDLLFLFCSRNPRHKVFHQLKYCVINLIKQSFEMKIFATTIYCSVLLIVAATTGLCAGCAAYPSRPGLNGTGNNPPSLAVQNLERSINLIDVTISHYFDPTTFEMRRFYNPFTNVKSE